MFFLSPLSLNRAFVLHATSPDNPQHRQQPIHNPSANSKPQNIRRPSKKKQLSSLRLQRTVGAGSFRDGEPEELEKMKSVSELLSKNAFEGPAEKKLREVGEWLADNTETTFRSSGKSMFLFLVQWMLPIWALALILASGMIKLPFHSTFMDDLIL